MKGSFKEVVKRKQMPFWQMIFVILSTVIVVNLLITSCNYLGEEYAGVASIIVLLLTAIACGFLITKLIAYYSYRVVEDKLIFEQNIGTRSKIILTLDLEEIHSIKPYREVVVDKTIKSTYKFVCDRDYDNFYIGEFSKEEKKYRFIFKPSSRLLRIITKEKYDKNTSS